MAFEKLTAYLDQLDRQGIPARDLVVYQDHQEVYRHFSGYRDDEKKIPLEGNEAYFLYSCTKVFTTCAVMQLMGQGKLHPDDPVAEYLPAFADLKVMEAGSVRPARRTMTIRHLMSMQGGLDYDLEFAARLVVPNVPKDEATTRQIVDAMALKPLSFDPGTNFQYSLCHDVLAAVVEAASGQKFSDYLKEHIWSPLGITSLSFRKTEDIEKQMCALYYYDREKQTYSLAPLERASFAFAPLYESGGGGLMGDVESCIRFADALACGGKGKNGAEILSPALIQLWSANQLCPKGRESFSGWKRYGYSYALGVRTRVDISQGGRGPLGEFGWDGAAGAWMMIDPTNHISAFYAQHVMNNDYCFNVIHPNLRNLIYEEMGL